MIELQKQKFDHKPSEGIIGDCYRTSIAMILGLYRDTVPHFAKQAFDEGLVIGTPEFAARFDEIFAGWRERQGLHTIYIAFDASTVADVDAIITAGDAFMGDLPYMIGGRSALGCDHIVARHRSMTQRWYDPSKIDSGIAGPQANGYFYLETLVRKP